MYCDRSCKGLSHSGRWIMREIRERESWVRCGVGREGVNACKSVILRDCFCNVSSWGRSYNVYVFSYSIGVLPFVVGFGRRGVLRAWVWWRG